MYSAAIYGMLYMWRNQKMDERLQNARNIIFDVGNVLLSFDPAKVITLLPQDAAGHVRAGAPLGRV